jgi:hypothetical protein
MTRTTSAKAFREETENGNITKKEIQVWEFLKYQGPATGRHISDMIPGGHKRLAELQRKGYVAEFARVVDRATGKTAIEWGACAPEQSLLFSHKVIKPTRKQLEAKLKETEMALERAQMGQDKAILGMARAYDIGYTQGRKDEWAGIWPIHG